VARGATKLKAKVAGDARNRILLAAEQLFAERGFEGVPVRDIARRARVNLAAINYYFGSKNTLLLAIFRLRTKELNRERLVLLREAEARFSGNPPLYDILRALLGPPILWRDPKSRKQLAARFISRMLVEVTPELRKILETDVSHWRVFLAPMRRALPHVSQSEICWSLHFAAGLAHQCTDTNFKRVQTLSDGQCNTDDVQAILERAIRFAIAGIEVLGVRSEDQKQESA